MLILTRRTGESTLIGDEITVTVLAIQGGLVRLGVDAPKDLPTVQKNDTTHIGNDIEVTVLGVKGNQARIGFTAPKEVPVHREEIYERIRQQNGLTFRRRKSQGRRPRVLLRRSSSEMETD